MIKLTLTKLQLRWIIDQLETSFETGQLNAAQQKAYDLLLAALHHSK